jgi:acetylornithine/N-succinyldiaminopimelate aminotransferase
MNPRNLAAHKPNDMNLFNVYSIFDIEPVKARGNYIWDRQGNQYLDLYGGHAVISIGHSHPHYVKAVTQQLQQIAFYSNSVRNPVQEKLALKLGESSGYPDYQLFLCNSGAEAIENALKVASFVTGRSKVIAFSGSFHGRTSGAVAVTDNPKILSPFNRNHDVIHLPLNDTEAFRVAISEEIAAVIIEGIQGVGGIRLPSEEFLQFLETGCKATGAKLILDEVQSGYGRTGKFFAHQHASIQPDLITTAKGMGNGFPVGGVLISPDIQPWTGMLGSTFGGNYLACAAALSVLEIMEIEDLITNAQELGNYLMEELKKLPLIEDIRGKGLMIGIDLPASCATLREDLLIKHKIFTGESKPRTIRLLPPLSLTRDQADYFLEVFAEELKNMEERSIAVH